MQRLRGVSGFFVRLAKRKLMRIALELKDDSVYKKRLIQRINQRVDIPNLSEEQEEKIIRTMIDSIAEFIVDVLD